MAAPTKQQSGAADFQQIVGALMPELADTLVKEHEREVEALYQEELELREELSRIVTLMTAEVVPRERTMHDLIEKMHEAFERATTTLHSKVGAHMDAVKEQSAKIKATQEQHIDPLNAMEEELKRIQTLLSHEVVRPDIQNWKAGGSGSRPGPVAAAPKRGASPPSRSPSKPTTPAATTRATPKQTTSPRQGGRDGFGRFV